jgi:dipeptidyl aminopeptidase/acylaminoacyl peptidase
MRRVRGVLVRGAAAVSVAAALAVFRAAPGAWAAERRPVTGDDQFAIRQVSEPQISPDGAWVAYVVETMDPKEDQRNSDLYMTSWDGARTVRLTYTAKDGETTPRFSPDGRYLAFVSSRQVEGETDQIWLLDRAGGEAEKISEFKGGVEDYVWSPDGKRLAVVALDPDPNAPAEGKEKKTAAPIVLDRYQFKQDMDGYLGPRRSHLYLFDLATRKTEALTSGQHDDLLPAFSPDGKSIAFVTKRGEDPDRDSNWDIYLIEARAGAKERPVTTSPAPDDDPEWGTRPAWSPDGKSIAYLQGGAQKDIYYAVYQAAVIPAAGGTPRLLTQGLDRNEVKLRFTADGASLVLLLEDDGSVHLAKVPAAGGKVDRLHTGRRTVSDFDLGRDGRIAFVQSTADAPEEVFALKGTETRPLSRQNDALLAMLHLGTTEPISFKSKDGTEIHGFVVKPPDYHAGARYPAILRIHGGPVGQYQNEFTFDWQLFAARGYVVIGANPRGSSGRGEAFSKAIYADWGNKDAQDVLAAVDHVVAQGIADPGRLGVGGWSYGGMLTNYTIAQDNRFKAAASGAGISNILAGYGTDQYIREYEFELGVPWKNLDAWTHVSFPFLHADRIKTPTLFLCGEKDFNVPLQNTEQMYQALKSQGVETELIIYPEQFHGISKPSYLKDRLERYLGWYDRHLMPQASATGR